MLLVLVLSSFLVSVISLHYYRKWYYDKHLNKFPGPPPYPIVGNILDFAGHRDFMSTFMNYQQKYGSVVRVQGPAGISALLITDPTFLEFVLSTTKILDKADNYKYLHRWLGTGLLTSTGAKWKTHRKILTPAFHFQILEQYIKVFDSASNVLIEKLGQEVDKSLVDIYPYITRCSLDIICETAMGTSVDAQNNPNSGYFSSVREMCKIIVQRSMSPLKMFDFFYYFSLDFQRERKALNILHGYTRSVIKTRQEEHKKPKKLDLDKNKSEIKEKLSFLELLLEAKIDGKPLSDEEIREEVDTFMFAGHDTISSALSFTLLCLANHPEVQSKVVVELASIFGGDINRCPTYRDLQEMKYLEAVIKETLRLYPSVPIYIRQLDKDVEYDGGLLPKNLLIGVFAYAIHRNAEIFPNPEMFDPDRFTSEIPVGSSPFCYIPFSAGPRNCIGQKFALLEIKATVSKILKNFELLPANPKHEVILRAETVLKSINGVCIRLKKRSW